MSKTFNFIVLLIFPHFLFSQTNDINNWKNFSNYYDNLYNPIKKTEIFNTSYNQDLSASGLNNNFFSPFIFNKKLKKSVIDDNLKNTKSKKINISKSYTFTYINLKKNPFKNKKINWLINSGANSRTAVRFTNDASKLIFKGNTDTSKYNMDNCYFFNMNLSKIGAGIFYADEKAAKPYNISIAVNFIRIQNYSKVVFFENNYLKSNEDSFDLGLNYDATFSSPTLAGFDGMGLSTDINFNYKFSKNSIFSIKINDLGFAKFNNSITFYTSNNEYKYSGIFIADIALLNNENYFQSQIDSTTNRFTNKQENLDKTLFVMPQTELSITTHHKTGYYTATLYHFGTKSQPSINVRFFNFVKPNILCGVSAGHFNSFYLNADASLSLRNKYFFQIGIRHIEALALPHLLGGAGLNAGFQFVF